MFSRDDNMQISIEDYKTRYVGSKTEMEDIKNAYLKQRGRIPSILKYIPYVESPADKQRIIDKIREMERNGEVKRMSDIVKPQLASRNNATTSTTNREMSVTSTATCSTPFSPSNSSMDSSFSNSHVGYEDILRKYPESMNDSREATNLSVLNTRGKEINDQATSKYIGSTGHHNTANKKRDREQGKSANKIVTGPNSANTSDKRRLDEEQVVTPRTKIQRIGPRHSSNVTNTKRVTNAGGEMPSNWATSSVSCLEGDFAVCEAIPGRSCKAKKERKREIENRLIAFRNLLSAHAKYLTDTTKTTIKTFNDMDNKYQCICLELVTNRKKWHPVLKFSRDILPDMEPTDIFRMVAELNKKGIVDTDYLQEDHKYLLKKLADTSTLNKICKDFEEENIMIYGESENEGKLNKWQIIDKLQEWCDGSSWKIDFLKKKIRNAIGDCMRTNENFLQTFYAAYLSCTFTNSGFSRMEKYFESVLVHKVLFSSFKIDEYLIFTSNADFISYAKARKYQNDYEELSDKEEILLFCKTVFEELKATKRVVQGRFAEAPHLVQFTARAVYVNILSDVAEKLLSKHPNYMKTLLQYMIGNIKEEFAEKIGCWYYNLIWLRMTCTGDYEEAARLLLEVLDENKQHNPPFLSDVQLHRLYDEGSILTRAKYKKISQKTKEDIIKLLAPVDNFKEIHVDEHNSSYKKFVHYTQSGERADDLILETFTLLFFDVIYNAKKYIPGTFVSNLQNEPLDMNTKYFYLNRKEEITQRLNEIESEWSHDELLNFLKGNYEKHSHEFLICKIGHNLEILEDLVRQIDRRVLANIYKRLAENVTEHRNGFPDLLIWTSDKKKYFVVVKKGKATLSVEQTLWFRYLHYIGANVGIIRLSSAHSKKNIKKTGNSKLPEASTSSNQDKTG